MMRKKMYALLGVIALCAGLFCLPSCSGKITPKKISARAESTKIDSPEAQETYHAIVKEIATMEKLSEIEVILRAIRFTEKEYLSKADTDIRFLVAEVAAVRATQILTERYLKDPPSDLEGV